MPPDTRPVNDRAQVTTPVGGEEREHGRRRTPGRKTFRQTSGLEIARAGDISAVPTPDFLIFGYQPLTPFPSIHSHVENQRERPPCPRTWRSQRSAEVLLQEHGGYIRSNAIHSAAITTKHSTLPSGPTDPPVNHRGPWNDELSR